MTIDKACLEANVDDGWHKDFHLDELSGKGLKVAIEVRDLLDKELGGLNPEPNGFGGCTSGCKLFKPSVSYVYSTGGYGDDDVKYHSGECKGLFSIVYDGGILYDFLSYDGDSACLFPNSHYKLRQSIERIAAKHGCMIEDSTSYAMTFYEDE